ncbi:hypothetical protein AGMMS50239_18650 [Bacteroidia bacterium]|nr:hypothetical protein AGMMS50239_18650 [Bacteroidia bacterium]
MNNLLILGAGVEKTDGINMPLANELVPQIRDFIFENEVGKEVDKKLREIIKGLRFSYDDFVKKAVDRLASDFKKEVNTILVQVKKTKETELLTNEQENIAKIVISFLEKIQRMQEDVILDEDTADLIRAVFKDVDIADENIVDLGKLSFSDTFEIVMKKILEISIREPNHPVLKHVYRNLMDFENLLLKHFIGFYNENLADIKKYLYISWTLWAFLVWKEQQTFITYNQQNVPFYSNIKQVNNVITFNYTSFAETYFQNVKYFHGNLKKYIRLDNRGECPIDDFENLNIVNFFEEILSPNIDFDKKHFVIPSIVPPLRLKPVLSNEYIDIWHNSVELIRQSSTIVIVGYSFNYADEHFNDLIRKNKEKKIIVIDPFAENVISNLSRIFSYRKEDYTTNKIQGKTSFQSGNLTIIQSMASEIVIDKLYS